MVDTARLATVSAHTFDRIAFRHIAPRYDPRSGEGARIRGGRFNPPGSYPVLYLCTTRPCVVAELMRFGRTQAIGVEALLPRSLYRYEVHLSRVLNLADETVLAHLELTHEFLVADRWENTQQLGLAAYHLGWQAVLSASATGTDEVLAVFPERLGGGDPSATLIESWERLEDLQLVGPSPNAESAVVHHDHSSLATFRPPSAE